MRRQSVSKNELRFLYDHKADVLSISTGQSVNTDSVPLDENVILHIDPATQAIVGFAIIDFIQRFVNTESPRSITIATTFERIKKINAKRKKATPGKHTARKTLRSHNATQSHNQ
jgi:uncharacterized protein YuzE